MSKYHKTIQSLALGALCICFTLGIIFLLQAREDAITSDYRALELQMANEQCDLVMIVHQSRKVYPSYIRYMCETVIVEWSE